jgi:hypothetical protein
MSVQNTALSVQNTVTSVRNIIVMHFISNQLE